MSVNGKAVLSGVQNWGENTLEAALQLTRTAMCQLLRVDAPFEAF